VLMDRPGLLPGLPSQHAGFCDRPTKITANLS